MSELFLLGAGASKDFGMPLSSELTEKVREYLVRTKISFGELTLFDYVMSTLKTYRLNEANIEDIVTVLEFFVGPEKAFFSPFVQQWNAGMLFFNQDTISSLLDNIRQAVVNILWIPYGSTNAEAEAKLRDQYKPLKKFLKYCHDNKAIIVTLNYDQVIELAAYLYGYEPYHYGLRFQDETPEGKKKKEIKIIKLHGSVNWVQDGDNSSPSKLNIKMPDYVQALRDANPDELDLPNVTTSRPHFILGGNNKVTTKEPYLQMLAHFYQELVEKNVNRLYVVGYSLQDKHVNDIIKQWYSNPYGHDKNADDFHSKTIQYISPNANRGHLEELGLIKNGTRTTDFQQYNFINALQMGFPSEEWRNRCSFEY